MFNTNCKTSQHGTKSSLSNPSGFTIFCHTITTSTLMHSFYKKYFDHVEIKPNENVLDFGCGWGEEAKILAKKLNKSGTLTCLDISSKFVEATKQRLKSYKNVTYICGDITVLPMPENHYSTIIIHVVLHDIDAKYRSQIMNSLVKTLPIGGKICVREPIMPERDMTETSLVNLMETNGLVKRGLNKTHSLWMGDLLEGVFEKR